jgi:hypothetical protein
MKRSLSNDLAFLFFMPWLAKQTINIDGPGSCEAPPTTQHGPPKAQAGTNLEPPDSSGFGGGQLLFVDFRQHVALAQCQNFRPLHGDPDRVQWAPAHQTRQGAGKYSRLASALTLSSEPNLKPGVATFLHKKEWNLLISESKTSFLFLLRDMCFVLAYLLLISVVAISCSLQIAALLACCLSSRPP